MPPEDVPEEPTPLAVVAMLLVRPATVHPTLSAALALLIMLCRAPRAPFPLVPIATVPDAKILLLLARDALPDFTS